jgi:hypothetical protein
VAKRLFDENSKYNQDANRLDRMMANVVRPLVKQFMEEGFCPRDIEYVLDGAVSMEVLSAIMNNDVARYKARKEAVGGVHVDNQSKSTCSGLFPTAEMAAQWAKDHLPDLELQVKPLLVEEWMRTFFEDMDCWTRDVDGCIPKKKVN